MARFKDNKDREWEIHIDAPSIMRIRNDKDGDPKFLLNDYEDKTTNTYARLQSDPVLLCRVIYLLCEEQRAERGISEKDFYMEVIGNAIDRATEAMLEAIVNFTPKRTREILEALAEQDKLRQRAMDKVVSKIRDPKLREELMTKLEEKIDGEVDQLVTRLSNVTSYPVSSESGPTN